MKILVVDDSVVQRKVVIKILREASFTNEILEASNGQEAIQQLGTNHKDVGLILCDWNMPVMSGIDFVEGVAKVPVLSKIPLMMVTTEGTQTKIEEARSKHPFLAGYIVKPFTPDQLKVKIQPFLKA